MGGIIVAGGPYRTPVGEVDGLTMGFAATVLLALVSVLLVTLFVRDTTDVSRGNTGSLGLRATLRNAESERARIALGIAAATLLLSPSLGVFTPLEGPINMRLGQDSSAFGLQLAAGIFGNLIAQYPVGRASDSYGRRPFILAGCALFVPATIAQALVASAGLMLLARLLQGIAVALIFAPTTALLGSIAEEGRSASYLALLTSTFGLGLAIGPVVAGVLFSVGGYQAPFTVTGIVGLLGAGVIFLLVREPSDTDDNTKDISHSGTESDSQDSE